MALFDIFKTRKNYNVSLHSVAKKLKISEESIISILQDAGFEVFNMPYFYLNGNHLEILSQNYVDAIKSFYNKKSKNFYELESKEKVELKKFFSNFIHFDYFSSTYFQDFSGDGIFKSKLDSRLIKDFFYQMIDEIEYESLYGNLYHIDGANPLYKEFKKFLYKVKLKTKSTYNNIKSRLSTILTTSRYYIFTDDEDHIARANFELCFSAIRNLSREALKNINYLKFQMQWKKLEYSYKI